MFTPGDSVRSVRFGKGQVVMDDGRTVVVQFEQGLERCLHSELTQVTTPLQALKRTEWDSPLMVVARVLGEAIESVNRWGVFSRSRIALLPHQLWVCRRVLESWPARWLVADDVGLGKTVEAGLILWPILSRKTAQRLLIICPASLVDQWQQRLRTMFDIRLSRYTAESDTKTGDFWYTSPQVVASLQTLRTDSNERHARMVDAPPWDLVVVDEAHHLNADEKSGPTLGYRLLQKLVEANRVNSMIFFTGTPHRGKNFGFLSLLRLLRSDLFDPRKALSQQLAGLRQVMIRNNKQNVTDLKGKRLFHPPKVTSRTYSYSIEELKFYVMLTEFIATGKTYASTLNTNDQRTVILVLISMQKLASSSVAAIRRALVRRVNKLKGATDELAKLERRRDILTTYEESEETEDLDELNRIEEQIAELVELQLVSDEQARLEQLIAAADEVKSETKMTEILAELQGPLKGRSILFFTEYKATQSLIMSELIRRFGDCSVAFINGDGCAEGVLMQNGQVKRLVEDRQTAAERFNNGQVQFLVSTEAAGEGIDLQRQCHTLIHVDLPWNPMRLHQRVGRLYRYGQSQQVEVLTLRNPDTVESRIWDKLNSKIDHIMQALLAVMDEPEDLMELVLGMTSPRLFRELFSDGAEVPTETLTSWFDQKTARFGGNDVVDTVRDLVGHCAHFDFQEMSDRIPKLDLPALRHFFLAMLALNNRRSQESDTGISFKTPDSWLKETAAKTSYSNMIFSRQSEPPIAIDRILGIGHVAFDEAIQQARDFHAVVASLPLAVLPHPLFVFRVSERLTSTSAIVRHIIVAAIVDDTGACEVLSDSQLIARVNDSLDRRTLRRDAPVAQPESANKIGYQLHLAQKAVEQQLQKLDVSFVVPQIEVLAILVPLKSDSEPEHTDE